MQKESCSRSILVGCFTLLTLALLGTSAFAQCPTPTTETWNASDGDWFTGTNWTPQGLPDDTVDAYISNAGTANINSSGAAAHSLTLGQTGGTKGSVEVNGGTLNVSDCSSTGQDINVGYYGSGILDISNSGSVSCGYMYIGRLTSGLSTSSGAVSVEGATLTVSTGGGQAWLYVGSPDNDSVGLLSVTNGGTVTVNNPNTGDPDTAPSITVGRSGTVTGNGTLSAASGSRIIGIVGTIAPTGTLTLDGNFYMNVNGTTACNVIPSGADNLAITGFAVLNGRLSITMTGDFSSAQSRYTLLHADSGIAFQSKFSTVSINYPTHQGWHPQITYDFDNGYVYLDRIPNHP